MMAAGARQFGDPDLPFLIVQLAGWGPRNAEPVESGFATIRDEQRQAVAADPHAALAVTIDLGDVVDIHPAEQAGCRPPPRPRVREALTYGGTGSASGPQAARHGLGSIETSVSVSALVSHTRRAAGFELCGRSRGW